MGIEFLLATCEENPWEGGFFPGDVTQVTMRTKYPTYFWWDAMGSNVEEDGMLHYKCFFGFSAAMMWIRSIVRRYAKGDMTDIGGMDEHGDLASDSTPNDGDIW